VIRGGQTVERENLEEGSLAIFQASCSATVLEAYGSKGGVSEEVREDQEEEEQTQ